MRKSRLNAINCTFELKQVDSMNGPVAFNVEFVVSRD